MTRWLRDAARTRSSLEWLQLLVPFPAFVLLIAGLIPFIFIKPLIDSAPGGGLPFALAMLAFLGWRSGRWRTTAASRMAAGRPSWTCAWRPGPASRSTATSWRRCW